jgi:hypothetical protein
MYSGYGGRLDCMSLVCSSFEPAKLVGNSSSTMAVLVGHKSTISETSREKGKFSLF